MGSQSACDSIREDVKVIRRMFSKLDLIVNGYENRANRDDVNWGHAGDLGQIKESLVDIVVGFEVQNFGGDETLAREAILEGLE